MARQQTEQVPSPAPQPATSSFYAFQSAMGNTPSAERPRDPCTSDQTDAKLGLDTQLVMNSAAPSKSPTLSALSPSTAGIFSRIKQDNTTQASRNGSFQCGIPSGNILPPTVLDTSSVNMTPNLDRPSTTFDKSKLKSHFLSFMAPMKSTTTVSTTQKPIDSSLGLKSQVNGPILDAPPTATTIKSVTTAQPKSAESPFATVAPKTVLKVSKPMESTAPGDTDTLLNTTELSLIPSQRHERKADEAATPSSTVTPSSRTPHRYVLSDGSVRTSGKGLGRGRPGIKRGPRKSKSSLVANNTPPAHAVSKKRKRASISGDEEDSTRTVISDSDPEDYTPQATQTRSGRHTQRPTNFVPTESPVTKKIRFSEDSASKLIKRKVYRGKEQNALCEHCLRGHGPLGNAIVFCDGCNRCWHQRCHTPMIAKELVIDTEKEWFCSNCVNTLSSAPQDENKAGTITLQQAKQDPTAVEATITNPGSSLLADPAAIAGSTPNDSSPLALTSLTTGRDLTPDQRQSYLSSLSRAHLIDLVLHASTLDPDLPLFPPPPNPVPNPTSTSTPFAPTPPPLVAPKPSSTFKTKTPSIPHSGTNSTSTSPSTNSDSDHVSDSDSEEYYFFDEHAKLYPKPGCGLAAFLPPESEDLHMLLEGPECRTFSHTLRGPGGGMEVEDRIGIGTGGGPGGVGVRA